MMQYVVESFKFFFKFNKPKFWVLRLFETISHKVSFIGSNFIQLLTEHEIDALVLRRKGSTPRINLAKQVNGWKEI